MWNSAFVCVYFRQATGIGVSEISRPKAKVFYDRLLEVEMPLTQQHLVDRLDTRGFASQQVLANIQRLPNTVSQHCRLNFLLWILNGLATMSSDRVAAFIASVGDTPCYLCGSAVDSSDHLIRCPVTKKIVD